jgi:hypothetical protein
MFRICNPFGVTAQVKSSKINTYAIKLNEEEDELNKEIFQLKIKSKPSSLRHTTQASANLLQDEVFAFVLDIKWSNCIYQEYEELLLANPFSLAMYFYDYHQVQTTQSLVKLLRNSFEGNKSSKNFSSNEFLEAFFALNQLLNTYQEYPPGFDISSPYNGNCFTSLEYTFICTVSF